MIEYKVSSDHFLVTYQVTPEHQGLRLDAFLKEKHTRRSREKIKRAIEKGSIQILRKNPAHAVGRIKPSLQLLPGDEIQILTPKQDEPPVNFNYRVVYEDEWLFVIDKPAPLPVHPAGRYFFHTLLTHLKTDGFSKALEAEKEYYLVHRIDKETSGLLILTKTQDTAAHVYDQFQKRIPEKRYLALVRGVLPVGEIVCSEPMARSKTSKIGLKMVVTPESEGGQSAQTRFVRRSLHKTPDGIFSLVECFPKTGRQHQIRVHLEHLGFPIVGDKLYGLPEHDALRFYQPVRFIPPELEARLLLPRHALHANWIRFQHPKTGEWLEFESDLPKDLANWINA